MEFKDRHSQIFDLLLFISVSTVNMEPHNKNTVHSDITDLS